VTFKAKKIGPAPRSIYAKLKPNVTPTTSVRRNCFEKTRPDNDKRSNVKVSLLPKVLNSSWLSLRGPSADWERTQVF